MHNDINWPSPFSSLPPQQKPSPSFFPNQLAPPTLEFTEYTPPHHTTGIGPSSPAYYLSRVSMEQKGYPRDEDRENVLARDLRASHPHPSGTVLRHALKSSAAPAVIAASPSPRGLSVRPHSNQLSSSGSSSSYPAPSPAPAASLAEDDLTPVSKKKEEIEREEPLPRQQDALHASASVSVSPSPSPVKQEPATPGVVAEEERIEQLVELRFERYKVELDEEFRARCLQATQWMASQSRREDSPRPDWDVEREVLRLQYEKAMGQQKTELQDSFAVTLAEQQSKWEATLHEKSRQVQELQEECTSLRFSNGELVLQECNRVREEEEQRWQQQLDSIQQDQERRLQALIAKHQEELYQLAAVQTRRETELQKVQERRMNTLQDSWAEQINTHKQVMEEKLKTKQTEVERLQHALDEARTILAKTEDEADRKALEAKDNAGIQFREQLKALQEGHWKERQTWQREKREMELALAKLQSDYSLVENEAGSLRASLEASQWNVTEAIAAWHSTHAEEQASKLQAEEARVRERCEQLLRSYLSQIEVEDSKRQEQLQKERQQLYDELWRLQQSERETLTRQRQEMEHEATRRVASARNEAQQHETAWRVQLQERERAVAERERHCVRRLEQAETEAVERGRAVVETELMKARVDLQQRYASLREAQHAWNESSAAWERELTASFAARFEQAKARLSEQTSALLRQLLEQHEEREVLLLQERASMLSRCTESFHQRWKLVAASAATEQQALHMELLRLKEDEDLTLRQREEALLRGIAVSREDIVRSMERRATDILAAQEDLLQRVHQEAERESAGRLEELQEAILKSARTSVESQQSFEDSVLQQTQVILRDGCRSLQDLLAVQRSAYQSGLQRLQEQWKESEQHRCQAMETARQEEHLAFGEALKVLEKSYLEQLHTVQAAARKSISALGNEMNDALALMQREQEERLKEMEETTDLQSKEVRGLYESKLRRLESQHQERVVAVQRRLEEAEVQHFAQRREWSQQLEAAYNDSLINLRAKMEQQEKDGFIKQKAQQLLVQETIADMHREVSSRFNDLTQRVVTASHEALREHRVAIRAKQEELGEELEAIRSHLASKLLTHLDEVEAQELELQAQKADHLETEMQHLKLLLEEKEKRMEVERLLQEAQQNSTPDVASATRNGEVTTGSRVRQASEHHDTDIRLAIPSSAEEAGLLHQHHLTQKIAFADSSSRSTTSSSADSSEDGSFAGRRAAEMEKISVRLEKLWQLLEVPEQERQQFYSQLRALSLTTPVAAAREKEREVAQLELCRLNSYLPLLQLVGKREVLLAQLARSPQRHAEDALQLQLKSLESTLLEAIHENESRYRKPFTYRGERLLLRIQPSLD